MRFVIAIAAFGVMAVSVACGGSDNKTSSTSNSSAPSTAATTAPTAAPALSAPTPPGTPSSGTPSAAAPGAANRVTGTVQSVSGSTITLSDGSNFTLAASARITKQATIKASDLQKGDFVAITAKRQPDNTLLASIVSIFPPSLSSTVPGGQRPLPEGNLMTNATIDTISGNSFTVVFTGGGSKITLAPDATLIKQNDATAADITAGTKISAAVNNGTAMSVAIQ